MKKIIWIAIAVVLMVGAAIVYFIVTFDANQCRSILVKQIESTIGYPVKLGNVSLTWSHGVGLRLDNFSIYPAAGSSEPSITVKEATADLEWLALLSQRVKIGSIGLTKPDIRLIRAANGSVRLAGAPEGQVKRPKVSAPTAAFSFLISRLEIEDGKLRLTDETLMPPLDLIAQKINVTVKDIAISQPVRFSGSMALWNRDENVRIKGRVTLPVLQSATEFQDLQLQIDLGAMDYSSLVRSCPNLKDAGINDALRGQLTADIDKLHLERQGLPSGSGAVTLRGGRVVLPMYGEIDHAELNIGVDDRDLSIRPSSVSFAGGTIEWQGAVRHYRETPATELEIKLSKLSIGQFPVKVREGEPRMLGELSVVAKLRANGKTWPEIQRNMAGDGNLSVKNGVIQNENLLREIFSRLSVIPGVVDRLLQQLPPSYQQKLSERDTRLRDIDQSFTIENGTVRMKQLAISTENLGLSGDASLGLDGGLGAQTVLVMDPTLSTAAIRSVNELQYLTDRQGQISLSVKFKGTLGHVMIVPDLQDVASRLAVSKATEMLGGVFQQTMGKQDSGGLGFPKKAPKGSTILAGILGSVLQAEQNSSSSSQ